MSDPATPPPQRVRVTAPVRRTPGVARVPASSLDAESAEGEVYLASLLREQARLAVITLALLFGTLGSIPLVFHLWPGLAEHHLVGIPVAWLLLGVLVHPFLLLLGWRYVRRAERNERDFAALLESHRS